jgi:hypothetical protein
MTIDVKAFKHRVFAIGFDAAVVELWCKPEYQERYTTRAELAKAMRNLPTSVQITGGQVQFK